MTIRPESDPRWQQLLAAKQSNSAKLIKIAGIGSYGRVEAFCRTTYHYSIETNIGNRHDSRSFPMDRGFQLKSIAFKRTVRVKPTKFHNLEFRNIPIPQALLDAD